MRGCRHPAQEHKQHHAKICNEKTGVWPPPGRRILVGLLQKTYAMTADPIKTLTNTTIVRAP